MINNEHYYRALNVMDRIDEIREEKGIIKTEFGKQLGHTMPYYHVTYNGFRIIKFSTLVNFAKVLDISVEYLLTGRNKDIFKPVKLDLELISSKRGKRFPNYLRVIKHYIKQGRTKDINLKTLFEFEHYLNIPVTNLLRGE